MKAKYIPPTHFSEIVRLDKPHISNSYLTSLKRALQGERQFGANLSFLSFGTEHHKRILEPDEAIIEMEFDQESTSYKMKQVTDNDKKFQSVLSGAMTEVEVKFIYRDVLVLMYADILKPRKGWDYKTTSAGSETSFITKARHDDYWRQAALYMYGTRRKQWEIVGQQKQDPHDLFWLPINDYPLYLKEGIEELEYLVDIHKGLRKHYELKLLSK